MSCSGSLCCSTAASVAAVTSFVLILSVGGIFWFQNTPWAHPASFTLEELYYPLEYVSSFIPKQSVLVSANSSQESVAVKEGSDKEPALAALGTGVGSAELEHEQVSAVGLRLERSRNLTSIAILVSCCENVSIVSGAEDSGKGWVRWDYYFQF